MKKLLSLVLALCLVFALAACGGNTEDVVAPTDATEESRGTLVVGMTIYEPMNYEDENGELTGFDTEFAKAFADKAGFDGVEFIEIDWGTKFIALEAGEFDCVWNGMTITDEAKANASVSNPYVKNAQVVVTTAEKAAELTSADALAGLTVAAEMGSAGASAVTDSGVECNLVEVDVQTTALLQVVAGKADACVIDITMAQSMLKEGTDFDSLAIAMELTSEEYGVAFKKGSPLVDEFNTIMAELMADGTLDALAEKYTLALVK